MLMMGTLKCGAAGSALEARYNSFINKNRDTLMTHNNVLKAHFMRQSGISGGQSAYDAFTTGLANSHSGRAQAANFCDMADTLVTLAEASNGDELMTMARNFSDKPAGVGEACEVTVAAAALPPVPITATVTPETPETAAAAAAAEPVPEVPATPAPQSAAAALEAAAIAMQAAAAALKEQQQAAQPAAEKVSTDGIDAEVVKEAPVVPPAGW